MFKQLRPIAVGRPDLADREALQEAFAEVLNDLNQIATAWNENIYPLLGSLPNSGAVRRVAANRDGTISPIPHGLDGSQVYMDMTTVPNANSNFLYSVDQNRPKTIKEVVLDSHSGLTSKMDRLENLVNVLEVNNAAFDDTEVKNWIRRVAANTWDEDEIALGANFDIANFGVDPGAPTKSVTYSLNQRNTNTRHICGVEGLGFEIQTPITLFAAANYIDDANDFVDALLLLDAEIAGLGGGVDLQDAYDNGRIIVPSGAAVPVRIGTDDSTDMALDLIGKLRMTYDNGVIEATNVQFAADYVAGGSGKSRLILEGTPGTMTEFITFERYDAATPEATLSVGKRTSDINEEIGVVEIGRETSGEGGEPHVCVKSEVRSTWTSGRVSAPQKLELDSVQSTLIKNGNTAVWLGSPASATTGFYSSDAEDGWIWSEMSAYDGDGWPTGGTQIGLLRTILNGFSDDPWQDVNAELTQGLLTVGAIQLEAWAPTIKSGTDYGIAHGPGAPDTDRLYKDNIVKAKAVFTVDVDNKGVSSEEGIESTEVRDNFNFKFDDDVGGCTWDYNLSQITLRFLSDMPTNWYSLTISAGETADLHLFRIVSQATDECVIDVFRWEGGDWIAVESDDPNFTLHVQIV